MDSAVRAAKMFELKKQSSMSILEGKYKDARAAQKELAKLGVEDFDTFVKVPGIKFANLPLIEGFPIIKKFIGFNLFKMFSKKTPEEKQLAKMFKEFLANKKASSNINKP